MVLPQQGWVYNWEKNKNKRRIRKANTKKKKKKKNEFKMSVDSGYGAHNRPARG